MIGPRRVAGPRRGIMMPTGIMMPGVASEMGHGVVRVRRRAFKLPPGRPSRRRRRGRSILSHSSGGPGPENRITACQRPVRYVTSVRLRPRHWQMPGSRRPVSGPGPPPSESEFKFSLRILSLVPPIHSPHLPPPVPAVLLCSFARSLRLAPSARTCSLSLSQPSPLSLPPSPPPISPSPSHRVSSLCPPTHTVTHTHTQAPWPLSALSAPSLRLSC
jgi:hypothetical protein